LNQKTRARKAFRRENRISRLKDYLFFDIQITIILIQGKRKRTRNRKAISDKENHSVPLHINKEIMKKLIASILIASFVSVISLESAIAAETAKLP
jgi:hypothetical protein